MQPWGERMDLLHLWVLPEAMGRGVGRSLFRHALERARILGFRELEIESDPNAEGFYRRIGAHRVGTSSRACLETTRGAAARDFGCGQGGEFRASPQRAVRNEPTPATDKRPAARRVFAEKAVWLRCSSVEDPRGIFSFVAPRHPAFSPKTAPLVVSKQALKVLAGHNRELPVLVYEFDHAAAYASHEAHFGPRPP